MCASVVTPWASTASPSFVQRSSRESSASSLRWSRKLSSGGFVRFDIGAGEGTTRRWVRECQKLGLRFDTVCTVFPEYPLKRAQRHLPNEGWCCGTSPRLMEYGKDTGWTVSSIPEANCILGGEFRVGLWSAESPPKRPTFSISHPFLFMAASIR